jgi:cytochrome c oxidase subunit 2
MSGQAHAISNLFIFTMILAGLICLGITGVLIYAIIRFRARPGDTGYPAQIFGNTRLEVTWTVIPFIIVTILFGTTVSTMVDSSPGQNALNGGAAKNPNRIQVIGHQWWWEIKYPSGVVTANEIHVPVGQRWVVALDSVDVIHSLWVPQCAPKDDLVPGQTNYLWLECDKVGTYQGDCSEFCGAGHAWMLLDVIAEPMAQFKAWEQSQMRTPAAPQQLTPASGFTSSQVVAGAKLYQYYSCQSCHYIKGVPGNPNGIAGNIRNVPSSNHSQPSVDYAPDLTHVGSRSILASGAINNTPSEMEQWLLNPDKIKNGVHMPNFQLSTIQARNLTAYLESLK